MFRKRRTQVLVAGAGPVGLFTALCLADRGVEVTLVDEGWRPAGHSYALALHPRSLELLAELGAADLLRRTGRRVERIAIYEGPERRAELDLAQLPAEFPHLLVLPQSDLERALESLLEERGVRVLWTHRLARVEQQGDQVEAEIEKLDKVAGGYAVAHSEWVVASAFSVNASYVVGADGHGSMVRRSAEIPCDAVAEPDLFAVFELAPEEDIKNEMRVIFAGETTNVLWPLPLGRCRWSFELEEHPDEPPIPREKSRLTVQIGERAFPYLTEETLLRLLESRAPWFPRRIREMGWSMMVRFERRLAGSFGEGRCWLAGDAAHLAGPVGIHSMNVGLREARELADGIAALLEGSRGPEVLESYGREFRGRWQRLLGLTGRVAADHDADPWIKDHAPRVFSSIPASGRDLERLATQLGLRWVEP